MKEKVNLHKESLPNHVAIVMDGNGRWAKSKDLSRGDGHKEGVKTVRRVIEASVELGIDYLTLYTFSTENWNRPKEEVDGLMNLLMVSLSKELSSLKENGIRLKFIGDFKQIPKEVQDGLKNCIEETKCNSGTTLVIALSYSARWEILESVKGIARKVKMKEIEVEDIDEALFETNLTTQGIPDPDLLIRTSGELRLSNFMLWQLAYTELYFTPILWPDFSKEHFYEAIYEFQQRERRLGKTSEQIADGTKNK